MLLLRRAYFFRVRIRATESGISAPYARTPGGVDMLPRTFVPHFLTLSLSFAVASLTNWPGHAPARAATGEYMSSICSRVA